MDTAQFETLKLMREKRRKLESLDQKKKAITKNMNKENESCRAKGRFCAFGGCGYAGGRRILFCR